MRWQLKISNWMKRFKLFMSLRNWWWNKEKTTKQWMFKLAICNILISNWPNKRRNSLDWKPLIAIVICQRFPVLKSKPSVQKQDKSPKQHLWQFIYLNLFRRNTSPEMLFVADAHVDCCCYWVHCENTKEFMGEIDTCPRTFCFACREGNILKSRF